VENNSNNRETLMKRIQVCGFVLDEVRLFLDTHPNHQEALNCYKKYLAMKQEAAAQYVQKYGPLNYEDFDNSSTWRWIEGPWPWENQKEV